MSDLLDAVLSRLQIVKEVERNGSNKHVVWCIFHPDGQGQPPHEPDLYIDEKGYKCFVCDASGSLKQLADHLGIEVSKTQRDPDKTAFTLFNGRGIRDETLKTLGVRPDTKGWGGALIPVYDIEDKEIATRLRASSGKKLWPKKDDDQRRARVMAAWKLIRQQNWVLLVPGETDFMVGFQAGLPVATLLHGEGSVYISDIQVFRTMNVKRLDVMYDLDEAGRRGAVKAFRIAEEVGISTRILELPSPGKGKDLCDLYKSLDYDDKALVKAVMDARVVQTSEPPTPRLSITRLSDVERREVKWLWPNRILKGNLNILAGDMGMGKSQMTLDIAARVTTGGVWLDGGIVEQGNVLIVSAEDDAATTIGPRVDALGGDSKRIFILGITVKEGEKDVSLSLPDHLPDIETFILENQIVLFIIDPLLAFTGGAKLDTHKTAEVRPLLAQLFTLAERTDSAILGIMHINKDVRQINSLHRISSSLAFVQAARSVIGVGVNPDDENRSVMVMIKHNLAPEAKPLGYHFTSEGVFTWETEDVEIDAKSIFAAPDMTPTSALDEADVFLDEVLKNGPVEISEINKASKENGIAQRTLERAKKRRKGTVGEIVTARISKGNEGEGSWAWKLQDRPYTTLGGLADFKTPQAHGEATPARLPYVDDSDTPPRDITNSRKTANTPTNEQPLAVLPEPVYNQPNNNNNNNIRKTANEGSTHARVRETNDPIPPGEKSSNTEDAQPGENQSTVESEVEAPSDRERF